MKEVQFVRRIAACYGDKAEQAIGACIESLDVPMNVRMGPPGYAPVLANQAYLDMMRRTYSRFLRAPLVESFHPDLVHNGRVNNYLRLVNDAFRVGSGSVDALLWNGHNEVCVSVEIVMFDDMGICAFKPISRLRAESPGLYPELHPSFHKRHTVSRIAAPRFPGQSPVFPLCPTPI